MNYEDVRTRFATYECLRLSRETRFILNDAPVLLEVDIGEPIYLPPPWGRKRQSLIDRFYAVLYRVFELSSGGPGSRKNFGP